MLPQENPHLYGHESVESALLESCQQGTLPHSWLISGAKGVGKATLAYRFARFLLNESTDVLQEGFGGLLPVEPVNTLAVEPESLLFERVAQGNHSDLKVIQPNEESASGTVITVDQIREIGGFFSLSSGETRYRIVIIDSADDMNRNAANALLKILEEPPSNAILLLVSHAPGRLLPTIRSRCRMLRLSPVSESNMWNILEKQEGDVDQQEASFAIKVASGAPGFALQLYHAGARAMYQAMLSQLQHIDVTSLYPYAESLSKKEQAPQWSVSVYLLRWLVYRAVEYGILPSMIEEVAEGEKAFLAELHQHTGAEWLVELWGRLGESEERTHQFNLDKKHAMVQMYGEFNHAGI